MNNRIYKWIDSINSALLIKLLLSILLLALISILVTLAIYFLQFNDGLSLKQETWGTFGDFIGGTLNPILSFLGLIALLFTIVLQNKEFEATREELTRTADAQEEIKKTQLTQQFENTFFSLLEQHNKILNELSAPPDNNESILAALIRQAPVKKDLEEAKKVIERYNNECGHYFRVLYQILKLIAVHRGGVGLDNFNQNIKNQPIHAEEKRYSNIVRSFISYDLMQILAINCYCGSSDSTYWSYKLLIERYEFLEHMPILPRAEKSLKDETIAYYDRKAFGNSGFLKTYLKENKQQDL